jgi:hypothetical protein
MNFGSSKTKQICVRNWLSSINSVFLSKKSSWILTHKHRNRSLDCRCNKCCCTVKYWAEYCQQLHEKHNLLCYEREWSLLKANNFRLMHIEQFSQWLQNTLYFPVIIIVIHWLTSLSICTQIYGKIRQKVYHSKTKNTQWAQRLPDEMFRSKFHFPKPGFFCYQIFQV